MPFKWFFMKWKVMTKKNLPLHFAFIFGNKEWMTKMFNGRFSRELFGSLLASTIALKETTMMMMMMKTHVDTITNCNTIRLWIGLRRKREESFLWHTKFFGDILPCAWIEVGWIIGYEHVWTFMLDSREMEIAPFDCICGRWKFNLTSRKICHFGKL